MSASLVLMHSTNRPTATLFRPEQLRSVSDVRGIAGTQYACGATRLPEEHQRRSASLTHYSGSGSDRLLSAFDITGTRKD